MKIKPVLKQQWFKAKELENHLDINLFSDIIAYAIQMLLIEKKHNLYVGISRTFDNITDHAFSNYILNWTAEGYRNLRFLLKRVIKLKERE